ncbi:hypothetical protein PROFUN_17085, partial [Planoprotostelium fungivorum]
MNKNLVDSSKHKRDIQVKLEVLKRLYFSTLRSTMTMNISVESAFKAERICTITISTKNATKLMQKQEKGPRGQGLGSNTFDALPSDHGNVLRTKNRP